MMGDPRPTDKDARTQTHRGPTMPEPQTWRDDQYELHPLEPRTWVGGEPRPDQQSAGRGRDIDEPAGHLDRAGERSPNEPDLPRPTDKDAQQEGATMNPERLVEETHGIPYPCPFTTCNWWALAPTIIAGRAALVEHVRSKHTSEQPR